MSFDNPEPPAAYPTVPTGDTHQPPPAGRQPPDTKGLLLGADIAKQVITLSIAIITLTMTFAEKLGSKTDGVIHIPVILKSAWGLLALSLVLSIWTLMSITGTLNELDKDGIETNPTRFNINFPARLMGASFGIGLLCVFFAGFKLSSSDPASAQPSPAPTTVTLAGISSKLTIPVQLVGVDSAQKTASVSVLLANKRTEAIPVEITSPCGSQEPRSKRNPKRR